MSSSLLAIACNSCGRRRHARVCRTSDSRASAARREPTSPRKSHLTAAWRCYDVCDCVRNGRVVRRRRTSTIRTGEPMSSPGVPEVREMIPAQRRVRIVELLKERRAVRVSSLSDDLRVSEMTIRRDLERLEAEGLLSRTHGGAILKRHMAEEPQYVEQRGDARRGEGAHRRGGGRHDPAGRDRVPELRHDGRARPAPRRAPSSRRGWSPTTSALSPRPTACDSRSSSWAGSSGRAPTWSTARRRSSS